MLKIKKTDEPFPMNGRTNRAKLGQFCWYRCPKIKTQKTTKLGITIFLVVLVPKEEFLSMQIHLVLIIA